MPTGVGEPVRAGRAPAGSLTGVNSSVVRVGLLGCGTVGSALVALVDEQRDAIEARAGVRLEIVRVAVRDATRPRAVSLPDGALTTDGAGLVVDPDVDVVVEVMGGVEPAGALVMAALAAGKPVVTANKELLAVAGPEVFTAAGAAGVDLLFEAAVVGGIPFVRPLRESLLGEPVNRVLGIMNGTTNYILTRMTEGGADYGDALAEAQALGYAEADPTADVEGFDAGAKIAIVASLAFGARVRAGDVACEGISGLAADDIAFAGRHGFVVKLLAVAERFGKADATEVMARVHPVFVPVTHPLASVRGSFNAVFVQGEVVGDLMFYGRGAGGDPTASAVLGDLIDAASNLRVGAHGSLGSFVDLPFRPVDELASAFYLSILAVDQPGVLATVAGVFGRHGVSIASMEQVVPPAGGASSAVGASLEPEREARIDFITHMAGERDVTDTIAELRRLDVVVRVGSVVRVLDDEPDR